MQIVIPDKLSLFATKSPHTVYVVGGFIRNQIAALPQSLDIDICGSVPAEEVIKGVGEGVTLATVNKKLGTALVGYHGLKLEYTQFRRERYDGTGNHSPVDVAFTDILKEDAARRDFTANSVYYDIKNCRIIDPFNGVNDIKNKILKSCDPNRIFASDGLRLMRLVRFAAELGFDIHFDTLSAAKENRHKLCDIAAERKRDELDKILNSDLRYNVSNAHYKGLKLLYSLGLFRYILPCIEDLEVEQNPKYHNHNVLDHTFLAVRYASPEVRLAALMHDVGKPVSLQKSGNMYSHAQESEAIVKKQLGQSGLKYSAAVVAEVARLVGLHMYDLNRKTSNGKMRLFVAKNFDVIDKLNMLCTADGLATGQANQMPPRFLHFKEMLLKEGAPITVKDLQIDGNDAIKAGLKNGDISTALQTLLHECILNPRLNARNWLLEQLNHMPR